MKVELISRSEVSNTVRYFAHQITGVNLLITENYDKLDITDFYFNQMKTFQLKDDELIIDSYFSDDNKHFLWSSDEGGLYYLNIDQNNVIKTTIPKNILLNTFYVWENGRFIIAGFEKGKSNIVLFFSYDIISHTLNQVSYTYIQEKYPFFKDVITCNAYNYLLYFNIKEEILVYRKVKESNEIIFQKGLDEQKIELNCADKELHRADFFDGMLALVHADYLVLYYQGTEFYRFEMDKKDWVFRSAHSFKHNDDFYCLITQFDITQPKRNIIEVYKVEV